MTHSLKYCDSLQHYSRFISREVNIGDVPMGNLQPIRIQSMTTTDTMDTMGTVAQTIRMVKAGCEYVRITAPSIKEAENLQNIKNELRKQGCLVPLIADIHFTPNAAEVAARIVEKVRVNPGNYADKKQFKALEYTDSSYQNELDKIFKKFSPLVKICKEYGTAMRIGVNHGSLSDRIMSRYGDTPEGMVHSAMEFIEMCETLQYQNLVISMKASNTQIMIQAYRLLMSEMILNNMSYPLHLGVTEAGDGEDGRIKSAVGIGTLLEDGLGDTIRVSLTEEPEYEIPVAQCLINRYAEQKSKPSTLAQERIAINPYQHKRRTTNTINAFGGHQVPKVIANLSTKTLSNNDLANIGYSYDDATDKYTLKDIAADFVYLGKHIPKTNIAGGVKIIYDYATWLNVAQTVESYPLFNSNEFSTAEKKSNSLNFIYWDTETLRNTTDKSSFISKLNVWIVESKQKHPMRDLRQIYFDLLENKIDVPVILKHAYQNTTNEAFLLHSASDMGALFTDGFGDGLWLEHLSSNAQQINELSFGILQATRCRISKTEYISCPSCGRTLFNLQEVTQQIRAKTQHLKGIKIGIMGCIVNGPGEMADADYGYVGSGVGKITLYRGQNVVKRNINSENAIEELIELIKLDGNWQ